MKKIISLFIILTLATGLFVGCGCSSGVTDVEKEENKKDIQKLLTKNKIPLNIKRDEKAFDLTEVANTIILQNKSKTIDNGTFFLFNYVKWNEEQEKDENLNIEKTINNADKLIKKLPKLKGGKNKVISEKVMFVQHKKIKKGKRKNWYITKISFQDRSDTQYKQSLLVYYISKNKKSVKTLKHFVEDFVKFDKRKLKRMGKEETSGMFDMLGK